MLIPDHSEKGSPIEVAVTADSFHFLTQGGQFKLPYVPGYMSNHGNVVISLAKFNRWLGEQVESLGVNVFPGFAGTQILEEGSFVTGVRTGDKGINAEGERKSNFEPGIDLRAKVTVFGDGPRGYLSKELIRQRNLSEGHTPQVYETGVKEVFEMPEGTTEPGRVIHTLGYPFGRDSIGGTWLYHMGGNLISVGLVMSLDNPDPFADQHRLYQQFKSHPFIEKMLSPGKPVQYGGKAISAGGYESIPKLTTDGAPARRRVCVDGRHAALERCSPRYEVGDARGGADLRSIEGKRLYRQDAGTVRDSLARELRGQVDAPHAQLSSCVVDRHAEGVLSSRHSTPDRWQRHPLARRCQRRFQNDQEHGRTTTAAQRKSRLPSTTVSITSTSYRTFTSQEPCTTRISHRT